MRRTCIAAVATVLVAGPGFAEQKELSFRLVTRPISMTTVALASLPDRTVTNGESVGVATFADGRIAYKDFVFTSDDTDAAGAFSGYSTYTFENGDSLTAKFVGSWSGDTEGGTYEILSGTGAYEGATGTGRFDRVDAAWDKASLFEGAFTLEVPGS